MWTGFYYHSIALTSSFNVAKQHYRQLLDSLANTLSLCQLANKDTQKEKKAKLDRR